MSITYLTGSQEENKMNNKELAQLLKDALNGQDSDSIWFVIGELEKEEVK